MGLVLSGARETIWGVMVVLSSRWRVWAGMACLIIGPVAQVVQYLVTPVSPADSPAKGVAQAAAHPAAMRWALAFDVPLILVIPAVLYVGLVGGAGRSRLAGAGTVLAFLPSVAAEFLLLGDALVYEASRRPDRAAAVSLVKAYYDNGVVAGLIVLYLAAHVVGFVLLAVALWRSRAVPRWAAVALGLSPVVEMLGVGSGVKPVGALGYALLAVGFIACAARLRGRSEIVESATSPAVAPAVAASR